MGVQWIMIQRGEQGKKREWFSKKKFSVAKTSVSKMRSYQTVVSERTRPRQEVGVKDRQREFD